MENQHNIFQHHDIVLAIHFLDEEMNRTVLNKTRRSIYETVGIWNSEEEAEDEDATSEAENLTFDYPKLEAAPNSKDWTLELLRRQVSKYLQKQGYGRNQKRLGEGKQPVGWPENQHKWTSFKGTGRGCSKKMLEEIIFALLTSQNINPEEYIEESSKDNPHGEIVEEVFEGETEVASIEAEMVTEATEMETNEDREMKKKHLELERQLRTAVGQLENEDTANKVELGDRSDTKRTSKSKVVEDPVTRKSIRTKKTRRDFFEFVK